jgi:hypothetical protein
MEDYKKKYLEYKIKYIELKKSMEKKTQSGGASPEEIIAKYNMLFKSKKIPQALVERYNDYKLHVDFPDTIKDYEEFGRLGDSLYEQMRAIETPDLSKKIIDKFDNIMKAQRNDLIQPELYEQMQEYKTRIATRPGSPTTIQLERSVMTQMDAIPNIQPPSVRATAYPTTAYPITAYPTTANSSLPYTSDSRLASQARERKSAFEQEYGPAPWMSVYEDENGRIRSFD